MKQNIIILLLIGLLTTQIMDLIHKDLKHYPMLEDISLELTKVNNQLKKIDISNDGNFLIELLKKAL